MDLSNDDILTVGIFVDAALSSESTINMLKLEEEYVRDNHSSSSEGLPGYRRSGSWPDSIHSLGHIIGSTIGCCVGIADIFSDIIAVYCWSSRMSLGFPSPVGRMEMAWSVCEVLESQKRAIGGKEKIREKNSAEKERPKLNESRPTVVQPDRRSNTNPQKRRRG
jgi:hypothetical protein